MIDRIGEETVALHIPTAWTPPRAFSKDINIMDIVNTWNINDDTKYKINICRLFKRCYYLGELLDPKGNKFKPNALSLKHRGFHTNKFPSIELPPSFESTWQFTLRTLVRSHKFGRSLGALEDISSFQWLLDDTKTYLIKRRYKKTHEYFKCTQQDQYSKVRSETPEQVVPRYVAQVGERSHAFILCSIEPIPGTVSSPIRSIASYNPFYESDANLYEDKNETSFQEYISLLPEAYIRNIGMVSNWSSVVELQKYMQKGLVMGVGDASVEDRRAAHSYIIETVDELYSLQGSAPVDGDRDDVTSNRAEGCTVLAILTLAVAITKFFELDHPKIKIFCDNAEALRHSMHNRMTYSKMTKRDVDIKIEVDKLRKLTSLQVYFCKVKGHADDDESFVYDDAPHEVRRNIDMDKLAKSFLRHPPPNYVQSQSPLMFPAQMVALKIHDKFIFGDIRKQIPLFYNGPPIEARIKSSL